ncbi:MAG: HAD family phosphatase [Candidatus Peribacteraceae bacterium]|nr:HAD family phosphatase [Candidatus Peribacteraceae bacterium]
MPSLAIIFDMDGVLADTERIHAAAECEVLKNHGIAFNADDLSKQYAGMPESAIWPAVFSAQKKPMPPIESLMNEKFEVFKNMVKSGIPPMPGAQDLIKLLKINGIPIGVASSAEPQYIELVLTELRLKHLFNAITASAEVMHGKPAPDIFLKAASKLGVDPQHCIVIEDARSGTLAAKAAGMKCIGLQYPGNNQDLSAATKIVVSLKEIDQSMLENL